MSLSAPTWITAMATAVLAIAVLVAAAVARKSLSARARQLAAQNELTKQLAEAVELQSQNLRMALEERRRAQACQVFIELKGTSVSEGAGGVAATVHNNSQQPIYDLYVIWQLGTTRMGKPDPAARLLPGQQVCFERSPEPADGDAPDSKGGGAEALTAFLTFRDTAGIRWTVREDGTLIAACHAGGYAERVCSSRTAPNITWTAASGDRAWLLAPASAVASASASSVISACGVATRACASGPRKVRADSAALRVGLARRQAQGLDDRRGLGGRHGHEPGGQAGRVHGDHAGQEAARDLDPVRLHQPTGRRLAPCLVAHHRERHERDGLAGLLDRHHSERERPRPAGVGGQHLGVLEQSQRVVCRCHGACGQLGPAR
jgi:hypothetical protein